MLCVCIEVSYVCNFMCYVQRALSLNFVLGDSALEKLSIIIIFIIILLLLLLLLRVRPLFNNFLSPQLNVTHLCNKNFDVSHPNRVLSLQRPLYVFVPAGKLATDDFNTTRLLFFSVCFVCFLSVSKPEVPLCG